MPLHCVIDIEASGFGSGSYPIEVGYVLPDGRAVCMLVQPASNWTHWDADAQRLHGITRAILCTHGRPAHDVALTLNRDLAGLTAYCNGWAHDYAWLATLFEAAQLLPSFKLESVARLLDEPGLVRLDAALRSVVAERGLQRHRASSDARALQQALQRAASG